METRKTSITYSDYVRGIKFLNIDERLTLLEIISARIKKSIGKKKKNSIMELEGLGANIWKGIDAQDYVRKERESWDLVNERNLWLIEDNCDALGSTYTSANR